MRCHLRGLRNADIRNMKNKDSQIDTIYLKPLEASMREWHGTPFYVLSFKGIRPQTCVIFIVALQCIALYHRTVNLCHMTRFVFICKWPKNAVQNLEQYMKAQQLHIRMHVFYRRFVRGRQKCIEHNYQPLRLRACVLYVVYGTLLVILGFLLGKL